MARVRLLGSLRERLGSAIFEVEARRLSEVLRALRGAVPDLASSEGRPSGLYVILIDGVDYRVYGEDPELKPDSEVTLIPVSHGG
ncbi:MAG: MoaD/ThiS family protein [Fervidicoccaceae archaeon]